MNTLLYRSRWQLARYPEIAVMMALASSLVFKHSVFGIMLAYLVLHVLMAGFNSLGNSWHAGDRPFFRSDRGLVHLTIIAHGTVILLLILIHSDGVQFLEIELKRIILSYTLMFFFIRYPLRALVLGAALGALGASAFASYEVYFLGIDRAGGPTNPIRFGAMAVIFAAIAHIGLVFLPWRRVEQILLLCSVIAGMYASLLAGSRGAALVVPLLFAIIAPRLWRESRISALISLAAVVVYMCALVRLDLGSMATRMLNLGDETLTALETGAALPLLSSSGQRFRLLGLAYELFMQSPVLCVGNNGWVAAVASDCCGPVNEFVQPFSQAHNQFADDLAKGGLLRGLSGIAPLVVPLILFLRRRPFSNGQGSVAALLGVVTSVGFIAFCLSDSMMILSLPSSIHAILVCYLICSCCSGDGQAPQPSLSERSSAPPLHTVPTVNP